MFYKICTICFLVMFGFFIYVEYLNALGNRFYMINGCEDMYDRWTDGIYGVEDNGKGMIYIDMAKMRKDAIYKSNKR